MMLMVMCKDGGSVELESALGGRRVYVTKAAPSDSGLYSCIARNAAGEASQTYRLSVLGSPSSPGTSLPSLNGALVAEPPKFRRPTFEQNVEITEGQPLHLACEATGNPEPTVPAHPNAAQMETQG